MRTNFFLKEHSSVNHRMSVFIIVLLSCFLISLPQGSYGQYCEIIPFEFGEGTDRTGNPNCSDWENYLPDEYAPELIIKINFHFLHDTALLEPKNFMPDWDGFDHNNPMNGYIFSDEILERLNTWVNEDTRLQIWQETIPTLPYRIRFELAGVHFTASNAYYGACNNAFGAIRNNFGINLSSEINCFFTNPENPNANQCGWGGAAGGDMVLIKQAWNDSYRRAVFPTGDDASYTYEQIYGHTFNMVAKNVLHELYHCLTLGHPICNGGGDSCDDTASRQQVIDATTTTENPEGCDPTGIAPNGSSCCKVGTDFSPESCCSNNLMDYSDGRALTPCQIAKSYANILLNKLEYLSDTHCTSNESVNIDAGGSLTWEGARIFKGDVYITNNTTVTIKCTVFMPEGRKFIIQPGSKLIIDGGIITNRCGLLWGGVEVRGSSNTTQSAANHGVLQMINGGTIEYAMVGAKTLSQQGGIIQCNGASFLNNQVSVEMNQYARMGTQGQLDNLSYFSKCHFEVNDVSRFGYWQRHDSFIKLWHVRGVRIMGCNFEVDEAITEVARGRGIWSGQASYRVIDFCPINNNPLGLPCPSQDAIRNQFTNLYQAIYSGGTGLTQMPVIDHAIFSKNEIGVYLTGFAQAQIINNDFEKGHTGLRLWACTGYEVEENNFNELSYGTYVGASGPYSNRIYRNNFTKCYTASMTLGNNKGINPNGVDQPGLEWKCNIYGNDTGQEDNIYSIALGRNATVSSYQGILGTNDAAAGNLFYPDCDPLGANYPESELKIAPNSFADSYFNYIHYPDNLNTPLCITSGIGLASFLSNDWDYGDDVCKKDISTGKGPIHAIGATKFNQGVLQVLMPVYDGYINNAVGPQLAVLIRDTTASSVEVRNALLDAAPSVTDNLLVRAIEREPAMDGWHLAQALLANSPLKDVVEKALKESDYNQYYIDLVDAYQTDSIAQRVIMGMDMVHYTMERDLAKDDLLRLYTIYDNDEPAWDSLLQMRTEYPYCVSQCEEVALLMEQGDYVTADGVLTSYSEQDTARMEMLKIALNMCVYPMDSLGLTSDQIGLLEEIAGDEEHPMNVTACMLLEYWHIRECTMDIESPDDLEPRSLRRKNASNDFGEIKALMAYPNPASQSIRVSTMVPPDCLSLVMNIYDSQGKLVGTHNMLSVHGMLELDCSKWQTGTYLMELIGDNFKLGTTNVVVVHKN